MRVVHSEFVLDVFGQRMNLERQVAAQHGVQEVEANWKFGAKAPVDSITKKFLWMAEDEIKCRNFNADTPEVEKETVFFGDAVEAPGIVWGFVVEAENVAHPLAAPRSGIEKWHDAERTRNSVT